MHFTNDDVLSNKPKIIVVEIGERDKKIDLMKNLLKQRKEQMFRHYQICKGCIQENEQVSQQPKCENINNDLIEIVNNYKKYYNEQLQKKGEQLANMKNINNHLDNLLNRQELSHEHINKIKREQKDLLEQLNTLDEEIDVLTKKID